MELATTLSLKEWIELLLLLGLTVLSIGRWVEGTRLRQAHMVDGHATVQGAIREVWGEVNGLKVLTNALQITIAQQGEAGARRDQEINRLRDRLDRQQNSLGSSRSRS